MAELQARQVERGARVDHAVVLPLLDAAAQVLLCQHPQRQLVRRALHLQLWIKSSQGAGKAGVKAAMRFLFRAHPQRQLEGWTLRKEITAGTSETDTLLLQTDSFHSGISGLQPDTCEALNSVTPSFL